MKQENSTLKVYMADTGLLISHAFSENQIMGDALYQKLLLDKLEVNEGMFVENIVAQMLKAAGHQLFFFSNYDKQVASENMEIDFLIAKSKITSRHNIIPIEVKSGKKYTLTSIHKFQTKYGQQTTTPIVLHSQDVKQENEMLYLPIYMACLL